MRTNVPSLLVGVLALIYGIYIAGLFISLAVGAYKPPSTPVNPFVLAALDMIVYIYLSTRILRGHVEFFAPLIFWNVFDTALALFGLSYRNEVFNLLSFFMVFFATYCVGFGSKEKKDILRSVGLIAGVIALIQGVYLTFAGLFTYASFSGSDVSLQSFVMTSILPIAVVAAIYVVSALGMIKGRREFFLLASLWILVESVLAVVFSWFGGLDFKLISIIVLACAGYYYFASHRVSSLF